MGSLNTVTTRRTLILGLGAGGLGYAIGSGLFSSSHTQRACEAGTSPGHAFTLAQQGAPVPCIDFDRELETLWIAAMETHEENEHIPVLAKRVTNEYRRSDPKRMTLPDYIHLMETVKHSVDREIDWELISPDASRLLIDLAAGIPGAGLAAYAITEHRAGEDGGRNVDYFDFLLRQGGREFIERKPSGGHGRLGFGLYQFTLVAHPSKTHGAWKVQRALPKGERLPERVEDLRGDDHIRAAYLQALHHMAALVRLLSPKDRKALHALLPDSPSFPVEFAAAAHHQPQGAYRAGKRWIRKGGLVPFQSQLDADRSSLRTYVRITAANYAFL